MATSIGLGNYAFLAGDTKEAADDEKSAEDTSLSASLLVDDDGGGPPSPFSHSQVQLLDHHDSSPISASALISSTEPQTLNAYDGNGGSLRSDASSQRREVDYEVEPTVLYRAIETRDWPAVISRTRHAPSEASTWVYRLGSDGKTIRWKVLPLHQVSQVKLQRVRAIILHL